MLRSVAVNMPSAADAPCVRFRGQCWRIHRSLRRTRSGVAEQVEDGTGNAPVPQATGEGEKVTGARCRRGTGDLLMFSGVTADIAPEDPSLDSATEVLSSARAFQEPVFVDDSGKRRRWIRIAFTVVGVVAFTYAVLLGWSIMGGPLGPASMIPFPDALNKSSVVRTSAPVVSSTAGPSASRATTTAPAPPKSVPHTSPGVPRPAAPAPTAPPVVTTPAPVTTTPGRTRSPRAPEGTLLPSDPIPSGIV